MNNAIVLLFVIPVLFLAFRYFNDAMAWITGTPVEQIADLGPDALQPILLVCLYLSCFATFSVVLAFFFERQLKDGSFGGWSRFAVLFTCFFAGACILAAGLL